MTNEENIATYLAKGYKAAQVASFCEVSEAHISALIKTESFKEVLREKMVEFQGERMTNRYNDLEETTLKQIKEEVANANISDLTRVLESISRIKSSNKQLPNPDNFRNPTLGLTLVFNQNNIPQLVTDGVNRIVAIGETTMMPMPAKAVRDMFNNMAIEQASQAVSGAIVEQRDETKEINNVTLTTAALKTITKEDLAA